jgi:hypothetical protein
LILWEIIQAGCFTIGSALDRKDEVCTPSHWYSCHISPLDAQRAAYTQAQTTSQNKEAWQQIVTDSFESGNFGLQVVAKLINQSGQCTDCKDIPG